MIPLGICNYGISSTVMLIRHTGQMSQMRDKSLIELRNVQRTLDIACLLTSFYLILTKCAAVKDLGVIINSRLSFEARVDNITKIRLSLSSQKYC